MSQMLLRRDINGRAVLVPNDPPTPASNPSLTELNKAAARPAPEGQELQFTPSGRRLRKPLRVAR